MPEIITDLDAQYALDIVKTICTRGGSWFARQLHRSGNGRLLLKRNWKSHLGAENVVIEEFTLAPEPA